MQERLKAFLRALTRFPWEWEHYLGGVLIRAQKLLVHILEKLKYLSWEWKHYLRGILIAFPLWRKVILFTLFYGFITKMGGAQRRLRELRE